MENWKNSLEQLIHTSLSIQVRLDGLSFFTQNPNTQEVGVYDVIGFGQNANPSNLVDLLQEAFKDHPVLSQPFTKVTVIYDNDLYTVVPQTLFDPNRASDYLKFNTKILSTDFVAYDEHTEQDKVTVYIPYANVNNYFFDLYGSFDYYHCNTLFLKYIYTTTTDTETARAFASIKSNSFDLAIIEKGSLLLTNTYRITSPEDFLYYLLFAFEQLDFTPNELPLVLLGDIDKESALYKGAYKYVRHCTIAAPLSSIFKKEDTLLATLL